MLFAPALRWLSLTLVILAVTVSASEQNVRRDDCDWYCWVGNRIDALTKQVDKLTNLLFPGDNTVQNHPGEETKPSSTPVRYISIFGTANGKPTLVPISTPIVTVTATRSSAVNPTAKPIPNPAVDDRKGYRAVGYFGNWDIYARKYFPQNIPAGKLTHLLYSFADNKDDGTIVLTDTWADTDIHYEGDSWSDSGKNVYGAMKQFGLLKQKNRNLKVMLSIGGWTYTNEKKHLDTPASTTAGRNKFASSCVNMIKDYGFDGIDIDWEYPQNTEQGSQFLALLKAIRSAMDAYADSLPSSSTYGKDAKPHFELSIAAPAGEPNYKNLPLKDISNTVDFINLMAYDYSGSWDQTSGHASNLHFSNSNPKSTPFNTDSVIKAYSAAGVPSSKLNLGMPLYGRAFTNTVGLGQSYNGLGKGSWEAGVYDFRDLPLAGAKEYYDAEAGATYSYDNSTGMLVSYDTLDMALKKVDYVKSGGVGGVMWWEVSGDRTDDKSIITNVVQKLAGSDGKGMESSSNWLYYPDSSYDNVKKGFAA